MVGFGGLVWVALAPPLAVWGRRGILATTLVVAGTVWASDLLATGLKAAFDRPRPFETTPEADPLLGGVVGASIPSGHAATSFAGAVVLTFLVGRAVPFLFALAVLISFSRVYVGVHYPLDVVAGAAVGTAVALAAVALLRTRFGMTTRRTGRAGRVRGKDAASHSSETPPAASSSDRTGLSGRPSERTGRHNPRSKRR